MDRGDHKRYHVHAFDSRLLLETYFSDKEELGFIEDALRFPMMKLHSIFTQGHVKGDSLIDISLGSAIHHLYSACGFFKEITLLRVTETCVMELNKWRDARTGAFDWSHTTNILTSILGDLEKSLDPETKLKAAMKPILRCDLNKENLIDPEIVPQADCVITGCLLDVISEDESDYKRNLKKIVNLVKPGGYLMLFGILNTTYFMVGEEKFYAFKYNEKFAREALIDEGLSIDYCYVKDRKEDSKLVNHEGVIFILAHKCK
ncbi:nicotinamide N-methyltransferase-like [Hyla sarda]|uniref:nicotinamide N-methyltransferase-like n=1 Tax=Hyla sarda TaxID=327740 RepID=UPI0024C38D2E|nr:nicotinamide N-methyltransferase-like [Hyla sarda]